MTAPHRDLRSFARTVEALRPYLDELVFVGGWAHYLYTVLPDAAPLGFDPLRTEDADIAAPLRLRARAETIPALLAAAGFELRLSGDHVPPISEYALGDERSGFLPLTKGLGFPLSRSATVQVANPASYVVQKVLALRKRQPAKQPKDVLYLHDTFSAFADSMPRLRASWDALRREMSPSHVRTFQAQARGLALEATDLGRSAARIAADRPRPPTPSLLRSVLQRGFRDGFGLEI